ncbi:MAG: hypothetical protein NWE89_12095 [Candidatus Bathyarchaeota archaeon]|nr:hypothetical protein [Candidatus Bathyarchaeota archaeon]
MRGESIEKGKEAPKDWPDQETGLRNPQLGDGRPDRSRRRRREQVKVTDDERDHRGRASDTRSEETGSREIETRGDDGARVAAKGKGAPGVRRAPKVAANEGDEEGHDMVLARARGDPLRRGVPDILRVDAAQAPTVNFHRGDERRARENGTSRRSRRTERRGWPT